MAINLPLVLDGAAGTYLESQGVELHPILWSSGSLLTASGQSDIHKLHQAYVDAGADVITSVTYQSSVPGLMQCGISETESLQLMTKAVLIAREEATRVGNARKIKVAAGLGAYGAYLSQGEEYSGKYGSTTYEELKEFWIPRVTAVLAADPDILLFETIPNLLEIQVILNELLPLAAEKKVPVWISLSLHIPTEETSAIKLADSTVLGKIKQTIDQSPNKDVLQAVGANCFDVNSTMRVLSSLDTFGLPKLVYPNSGESYDGEAKTWQKNICSNADDAWEPALWAQHGALIVGGCCRTSPKTISSLKEALEMC